MSLIILSDNINSGKSTFCLALANYFLKDFSVNGWITSPLKNNENVKIGQEILTIKNSIFSKPRTFFTYSNGFETDAFIDNDFPAGDLFFMDELGPLEISKGGFYSIAKQMLFKSKISFAVIRKGLVEDMSKTICFKPDYILNLNEAKENALSIITEQLAFKK